MYFTERDIDARQSPSPSPAKNSRTAYLQTQSTVLKIYPEASIQLAEMIKSKASLTLATEGQEIRVSLSPAEINSSLKGLEISEEETQNLIELLKP